MIVRKFQIGDQLKDNVTGFVGVVMGISEYATGCLHYGLAATKPKADGTLADWQWIDQSRLVLVKSQKVKFEQYGKTSGMFPNPPAL